MVLTLFNIFYVLIAIAMCILILLQRGAGAQAGSGFGGGASATVFGARGASTFLSRGTGVLAALFFLLSILMGIYLHPSNNTPQQADLGLMSGAGATAPVKTPATPANSDVPAAPAKSDVPPAPVKSDVPAAPAAAASGSDKPALIPAAAATAPAKNADNAGKPAKPDVPKKH
ncbi:MAG: preprotein translocase subunit SecG [Rudaea sp.]